MSDDLHATVRDDGPGATVPWWESTPAVGHDGAPPPQLAAVGPAELFAQHALPVADEALGPRYAIQRPLGAGAGGTVWAAHDQRLDRPVAIKVKARSAAGVGMDLALRGFLGEARIAASLRHPNVLAVHDLDVTADGDPCFIMQRLDGMTLGDAMRAKVTGEMAPVIAGLNDVVSVFIAIGQALAYAHHHGVVHQDVKPDNVLLGDFGEVTLVDWGCAVRGRSTSGRMSGTPIYMAPEQARREGGDARSDVYALGASLFHALVGRPPLPPGEDAAHFWQRKQRGECDPLTPVEAAALPAALRAIIHKALAAEPDQRYADAEAMVADLRAYQAGLAVVAWRDPLWHRLVRWYRHHRAACWVAAVALVLVVIAVGWAWREQARSRTDWTVVAEDDFSDAERSARWWRVLLNRDNWPDLDLVAEPPIVGNEHVGIRDGRLRLGSPHHLTNIVFREQFAGDLRVEWRVRSLEAAQNLNCFLGSDRVSGYTFHIGGWSDPTYCALTFGKDVDMLSQARLASPIVTGREYHFRLERVGPRLQMWLDGQQLFDHIDHDDERVVAPQAFGFDTWRGNVYEVSWVRIAVRPLPERVSPLAIGIALAHSGQHVEAARSFDALATTYATTPLGRTAQFRGAFSRLRLADHHEEGRQQLLQLVRTHADHDLAPYAWFELMLDASRRGDEPAIEAARSGLIPYTGHPLRQRIIHDLGRDLIRKDYHPDEVEAIARRVADELATWTRRYNLQSLGNAFFTNMAEELLRLGHGDLIQAGLPVQHQAVAGALFEEGRYAEVRAGWPHLPQRYIHACFRMQDIPALLDHGSARALEWAALALGDVALARQAKAGNGLIAELLLLHGNHAAVADDPEMPDDARLMALLNAGRFEEALLLETQRDSAIASLPLVMLGKLAEARDLAAKRSWMLRIVASAHWQRGEHDAAQALFADPSLAHLDFTDAMVLLQAITWPELCHGDPARMRERWQAWLPRLRYSNGRLVWHILAYALGEIDEVGFRAQPTRSEIDKFWPLAQALRAELTADVPAAHAAWLAYAEVMPPINTVHWSMRQFAIWRAEHLGP